MLLKICTPNQNLIFKIHDPLRINFLIRVRLRHLSHLDKHRYSHNFQDCLNPLCSGSLENESIANFFLHCHHFNKFRQTPLDSVKKISNDILTLTDDALVNLLLYGCQTYNFEENSKITKTSIKYILSTERFSNPLM